MAARVLSASAKPVLRIDKITLKAMSDPMPKRSGGILGFLKNVMGFLEITSL